MIERKLRIAKDALSDLREAVANEVYYESRKGVLVNGTYIKALKESIEVDNRSADPWVFSHYMSYEDDESAFLYDNESGEEVDVMDLNANQLLEVARALE